MNEAAHQQQFNRNVEDVEGWLADIEGSLISEDYGKVRDKPRYSQHPLTKCLAGPQIGSHWPQMGQIWDFLTHSLRN